MSRRTPLYERHVSHGARMVDFAGWEMPVQYAGILDEHRAVREACGVFDISHMGEFFVRGGEAATWLDSLLTNRVAALGIGQAQYSLMLNEHGGVIDDLIVYRTGPQEFLLIVNAAKIEEDFACLHQRVPEQSVGSFELIDLSDAYSALAVQGPNAPDVFTRVFSRPLEHRRNQIIEIDTPEAQPAPGNPALRSFAATTGYTGESGFELIVPANMATRYWDLLLAADAKPCGLGARDTLRLEMCYPLNGSDLSPERTPLEAGLGAFVDLGKAGFVGRAALLKQKEAGVPTRLSAIRVQEKSPPIRPHYAILSEGRKVAETTSGALSPSLGCGIALGYLPFPLAKAEQNLEIEVRGRRYRACVVKKPFYKPRS